MSNYTPITNFGAKDALVSGNPAKGVKGADITAELTAISAAVGTKLDSSGGAGLFSDGSAGAPSISFVSVPTTGIFNISGQLNFTTNSVARMSVGTTGSISIAQPASGLALSVTTNPGATGIQINGGSNANSGNEIFLSRTSSANTISNGPAILFADSTASNSVALQMGAGIFGVWNFGSGVWTNRLSLSSAGNVVIAPPLSGVSLTLSAGGSYATPQLNFLNSAYGLGVDATGTSFFKNTNNGHDFFTNSGGATTLDINQGNVSVLAPSSGVALSIGSAATSSALSLNSNGSNTSALVIDTTNGNFAAQQLNIAGTARAYFGVAGAAAQLVNDSATNDFVFRANTAAIRLTTNGGASTNFSVSSAGNVLCNSPASGNTLTVTGLAGATGLYVTSPNTASSSFGVNIAAGTNASDSALTVNSAVATALFKVLGDGSSVFGSPTGGAKGAGTLNATGYYTNGTNNIQTGTFTGTLTDCTTAPTVVFNYTIVNGVQATIDTNLGVTATSNTTAATITGLPAILTPTRGNIQVACNRLVDAGANVAGSVNVNGTTLILSKLSGAFTASGTKGISPFSITYNLV